MARDGFNGGAESAVTLVEDFAALAPGLGVPVAAVLGADHPYALWATRSLAQLRGGGENRL